MTNLSKKVGELTTKTASMDQNVELMERQRTLLTEAVNSYKYITLPPQDALRIQQIHTALSSVKAGFDTLGTLTDEMKRMGKAQ